MGIWGYNIHKLTYSIGVITRLIAGRGPPCWEYHLVCCKTRTLQIPIPPLAGERVLHRGLFGGLFNGTLPSHEQRTGRKGPWTKDLQETLLFHPNTWGYMGYIGTMTNLKTFHYKFMSHPLYQISSLSAFYFCKALPTPDISSQFQPAK